MIVYSNLLTFDMFDTDVYVKIPQLRCCHVMRKYPSLTSFPYSFVLSLFFGVGLLASRFGVSQFSPLTFVGLRLSLASLGYILVIVLYKHRSWPTDIGIWKYAPALGLLWTALPQICVIWSLRYQSAGITSIVLSTAPAITVVLAHLFLPEESLTQRKGIGTILAMSGLFLLLMRGESGLEEVASANVIGYSLVLFAVLLTSGMTIYARVKLTGFDTFDITSIRIWVGAGIVLPLSFLLDGLTFEGVRLSGVLALGYSSIFGVFSGYLLAFYIIKRFGATHWAITFFMVPAVSTIGGVIFLSEKITTYMLLGILLISAGIALIVSQTSGDSDRDQIILQ